MMRGKRGRGFTLVECALAGVVVLVAIALLGLMAGRSRKMGQLGESMANLRRIGELTGSYGNDYQDHVWGLTWRPDRFPANIDQDLQVAARFSDQLAAGAQATHIMRRLGNDPAMPPPHNWVPHVRFSHMPLLEYANTELPALWTISPGDRNRLRWATDIAGFRQNRYGSDQPDAINPDSWRMCYSSSYDFSYAFYGPDSGDTHMQADSHYYYYAPTSYATVGPRLLTDVRYPSQKALMWDMWAWYFGTRTSFFMIPESRVPVLFVDGAVGVRTRVEWRYPEGNGGWNPRSPSLIFALTVSYQPPTWEPAVPRGGNSLSVFGCQRWTRQGLQGRDFDGPDVR